MRHLSGSLVLRLGAALGVASGCMFASLATVQAGDPVEQKILVFTSDEGEETDENKDRRIKVKVQKEPKLWLGIMLKEVEGDLARYLDSDEGILVDSVVEDSPAQEAGMQAGDILLSVGETQLTEPSDLLKVMGGLKDKDTRLEITLLRKGEKQTVEVAPAERPEMKVNVDVEMLKNLHADLTEVGEKGEAVKELVKRLKVGDLDEDMNIFHFGSPSMIFRGHDKSAAIEGNLEAVIVREDDDKKKVEVKITRENGKPAIVVVTKDGEVTEYSEENLKDMPEEIAVIVEPLVDGKEGVHVGRVHIAGPEWTDIEVGNIDHKEIVKRAKEMAEKGRAMAVEKARAARTARTKLRGAADEEVQQLKEMVEELRGEIDKLRAELKKKD